jgi:CheY-like chemotaxis protein
MPQTTRNDVKDLPATVMVVDDQATSRFLLGDLINSLNLGVTVQSYEDPHAALTAATQQPPILVITDYWMPEMDGISFVKSFRTLPAGADTPIVMVTVADDVTVKARALEAGVTDFLHKPVDRDECRARCRNLLLLGRQMASLKRTAALLQGEVRELNDIVEHLLPGLRTGEVSREEVAAREFVAIEYMQLFRLTSTVKAFGILVAQAQHAVDEVQDGLSVPLYGKTSSPIES